MKIVHKNLKQGEMKLLIETPEDVWQTLRKFDQKELLVRIREENNRCFANANMESSFSDIFTKSLKLGRQHK